MFAGVSCVFGAMLIMILMLAGLVTMITNNKIGLCAFSIFVAS